MRHATKMRRERRIPSWVVLAAGALLVTALPVAGQGHEGEGGGCGDVFGDLIHILRDDVTGQPILAQRWIELPEELPGFGWGYCPIAVFPKTGDCEIPVGDDLCEIPFLPYSCDLDPYYLDLVQEVDYFGRLSGGRTKERNHRMHLDEVIASIKSADMVKEDATGRLLLGYDCNEPGRPPCAEWSTVDSPMESMALYTRLMKYGHIATDPYEIDTWAHGDPELPPQFHPALEADDWKKFHWSVSHLLPGNGSDPDACFDASGAEPFTDEPPYNGVWDPTELFIDINGNGTWDAFTFLCAEPEKLSNRDFMRAAAFLSGAANKDGWITVDLVQYINRILKVTQETALTRATLDTLPALYRDCWTGPDPADPPEVGEWVDPPYDEVCSIVEADPVATPGYDLFPDLQELFVDFAGLDDYEREDESVEVILETSDTTWALFEQSLLEWIELVNADQPATNQIDGFVDAANDRLRSIEYVHNYAVPENLYCVYETTACVE